jgi:drug/metabolite transporter (DMT)-like permease
VGALLGLLSAGFFGSGDFLGGRASRDGSTTAVLFVVQISAAIAAVLLAFVFHGSPIGEDVAFGAAAGAVNALGLGFLYNGLATGRMGIVAPVAAVVAAVLPVTWGLLTGERPGGVVIAGVVVAVVAVGLIAREREEHAEAAPTRSIVIAMIAGAGLGASLIFYAQTGSDSGFWPVLSGRVVAVVVAGLAIAVASRSERVHLGPGPLRTAVIAGLFDVTATALLVVGVRNDLAVVVAPLAALAPGFTVVLAWLVLKEPISRAQTFGLGLALVGLVLIAAG